MGGAAGRFGLGGRSDAAGSGHAWARYDGGMKNHTCGCWAVRGRALVAVVLAVGAGGCRERGVEEQRVPKGADAPADVPAEGGAAGAALPGDAPVEAGGGVAPAGAAAQTGGAGGAAWPWRVPEGWREADEAVPMRLVTYEAPVSGGVAEVAVSRFPGDVGGMLANVNRWRGQVGLAPVGEGEVEGLLERFESPGFSGALLHLEGAERDMLAASIYEAAEDRTWFVRVTAPAEVARAVKGEVFAFARSFGAGG